ncbi:Glycine cleavage system H protein, mitochondrial [Vitis vinifera]|uniref:Glycine cleavage system H protein n=1 Tax=Vitis vinifera TaxID=29760 RepID=A0A438JZU4_VITVI|nr:Glycine cleavage system H protein, mitochondrial [Vitis vinifera]
MALRMWASSTANALRVSCASKAHVSPAFSLSRCFPLVPFSSNLMVLDGLKYATSHEWVKHEGSVATIGITDHAQDHLGEVVFVELPEPGGSVSKGNGFGAVESVKATSDVNSPISGEVVEVNSKLSEAPGLINSSPYEDGWMIKVKPGNPSELESLMGQRNIRNSVRKKMLPIRIFHMFFVYAFLNRLTLSC